MTIFNSVFAIFFSLRLLLFLSLLTTLKIIPYLGFFPYSEILPSFHLPKFLSSLANFDGVHYLLIAKQGYSTYEQAFFPLYPLLIKYFSRLFINNYLLTALIISNLSFLVGLYFFSKFLQLIFGKFDRFRPSKTWSLSTLIIFFLLVFPTSFFFSTVYTEGLFFSFFSACLYFLKKKKWLLPAIFAFLASLTRLIGIFLIIPIGLHVLKNYRLQANNHKKIAYRLVALIAPLAGLTCYCLYLWYSIGDPLFFFHSQWAFGAHRSSNFILLPQVFWRYLNIFFTAGLNFQYFISLFEFITFSFILIVLILDLIKNLKLKNKNFDLLGLNIFSLANLLLPTLTGTFSSIPRYALFSLSFFVFLAQMRNILLKFSLAAFFFFLQIILFAFFIQGYFVS